MSSTRALALTLYRALLRSSKDLEALQGKHVAFRFPIDPGSPSTLSQSYPTAEDYRNGVLKQLFPYLPETTDGCNLISDRVRQIIKLHFKARTDGNADTIREALDQAIDALRIFASQRLITETCSSTLTEDIMVEVVPSFISKSPSARNPGASRWLWAYRCQIENRRATDVQLTGRHWIIMDNASRVSAEVPRYSPGVIGQQPVMKPGSIFEYHSMVDLETPSGSMQGCFHCVTLDGQGLPNEPLDARIRPFKLISPESASD